MELAARELNRYLDRWLRRYRLQRALAWGLRGMDFGLLLAVGIALALLLQSRLVREEYWLALGIGALAGAACGAAAGWLWPVSRLWAARFFDLRFGLKERVSTALELSARPDLAPAFVVQQAEDALAAAGGVDLRRLLPFRIPWWEAAVVLALASGAGGVYIAADQPFIKAGEQRQVEQALEGQAEALQELIERIQADERLTPSQRQALTQPLEEAQQQLQSAETAEQGVAILTTAEDALNAIDPAGLQEQIQDLQQLGRELGRQGSPLQEAGGALARGDLGAAAEALENLGPSDMSPEEQAALADQLDQAAAALQDSDPALAGQLSQAAENLRRGDSAQATQSLQQAAEALRQQARNAQTAQLAREAAAELRQGSRQLAQAAGQGAGTAQAGTGQAGQNGQDGQGQTGGPGQSGQGQTAQGGQSQGGAGRGEGQGTGQPGTEAGTDPIPQDNAPGDGGERPFEQVYAPGRLGGEGGEELPLPGSGEPGEEVVGQSETATGEPGAARVPYVEVLPAYQEAVRQAIESGEIPAHLRGLIRQYFSSLEP